MVRVVLEDVHVDFPIYGTQHLSLRRTIFERATGGVIDSGADGNGRVVVKALSGINMHLEEGDRLGLIGHNGSGKSTLLKAMAGIYEPVRGKLLVEGRVTPLFDMMPGLDVEDSGYENIFTSGMLLGMSRDYIENKIPEIEEFCELGEYLSLPVRTYSAGMSTRLGFALVTALNPDVLLMDEGFGAADLRFAEKSAERMEDFIGRSRIMVIASHSDAMITSICNKLAWFSEGRLVEIGPVEEVFEKYHASVHRMSRRKLTQATAEDAADPVDEPTENSSSARAPFDGENLRSFSLESRLSRTSGAARFTKIRVGADDGEQRWRYRSGETIKVLAEYEIFKDTKSLAIILRLSDLEESTQATSELIVTDFIEVISASALEAGHKGCVEFTLPSIKLRKNELAIYMSLVDVGNKIGFDVIDHGMGMPLLRIDDSPSEERRFLAGVVSLDAGFRVISSSQAAVGGG